METKVFKIESLSTVSLINAQWIGNVDDIKNIRLNNIKNHRLINTGIPISLEEMDLFISWVEQGKSLGEIVSFFQRKITNIDKSLKKIKETKEKHKGRYKIYSFNNKKLKEINTTKQINLFNKERPKNHYKRWDSDSKDELVNKFTNGSTIPELAKYFERTLGSIFGILFDNGLIEKDDILSPPTIQQKQENNIKLGRPKNNGLPWSPKTLDDLIYRFTNGSTISELANYFERTSGSIQGALKIKEKIRSNRNLLHPPASEYNNTIRYKRGFRVQSPNNEDWGTGIVLSVDNSNIKSFFEKAGFKAFKLGFVKLKVIESKALSNQDIKEITGKWILKQKGVTSLWHITHRNNITNILLYGLLNQFKLHQAIPPFYTDISSQDVQARRTKPDPIYGKNLHTYVPLYINPRNAMLYSKQIEYPKNLCLIKISLDVLTNRYIFTDGNAARNSVNFYSDLETQYENIPWNDVFSERWVEGNTRHLDTMSHMQSEFLIYQKIESKFIKKIHCHSQETVDFVNNGLKPHNGYIKAVNIEINSNAFF